MNFEENMDEYIVPESREYTFTVSKDIEYTFFNTSNGSTAVIIKKLEGSPYTYNLVVHNNCFDKSIIKYKFNDSTFTKTVGANKFFKHVFTVTNGSNCSTFTIKYKFISVKPND